MSLQYLADLETPASTSHTAPVLSVCWTSGVILSSDLTGVIKAWHPVTLHPFAALPHPHKNSVHSLTTHRQGRYVLSSSIDGSLALWDLSVLPLSPVGEHERIGDQVDHDVNAPIAQPAAVPDTVLAMSTSSVASTAQGISEAWSTCLHPTLPLFASVGIGARPSLHSSSLDTFGDLLTVSTPHDSSSSLFGTKLALNDQGTLLAVGTSNGQVFLYSLHQFYQGEWQLDLLLTYADHALPIRAVHFDAKDHLIVGCDDLTVTLHDVRAQRRGAQGDREGGEVRLGGTVAALQGHRGWIMDIKSCPNAEGRIIATSSTDRTIKLWDLAQTPKMCVCTCTELDDVWTLAWKPSAASSSAPVWTSSTTATATSIGGLGQGSKFVTGGHDGKVRLYRSAGV